ncbi:MULTISPECIES: type II toxin-antitoxin system RelB/DinJ family antitoxin [Fructilactobacillus]|uniref:Type II toxin-antitoxin system RelB/DinJ family antitoxin n=2 Tax=Fructilactobacillus TaxID=2767881 RepID=A0A9Q9E2V8_9LACO|nr:MULTISPECIES: type II toxin-antitoxin system RelB/DinJ family antitoxin [Fructilactobacillus]USS85892.1 type II toxin-antitoxin system RelB/DinJ family antitoxin [Fructilactobacillus cliffordii]USS88973.1 type II toxin-antitoxin system RelB/DinJ family antitoxin [Fructilactobacillus cliffordii]USS90377.1 type II toxin-antitoxin system RelB/DinJ family antitoxin [Fructilactobacillus carniphilus]
MKTNTAQIHFRTSTLNKDEFEKVLKENGLTAPEAFRIFMKQTINNNGLPFEVNQPNKRLKTAISSDDYVKFDNAQEGLDWLND